MAESPALLSAFLAVREIYHRGTLSPAEAQVISLTGRTPTDPRFGALSDFARAMLQRRGAIGGDQLRRFLDAGYTRQQAPHTPATLIDVTT